MVLGGAHMGTGGGKGGVTPRLKVIFQIPPPADFLYLLASDLFPPPEALIFAPPPHGLTSY